jgi:hypothetical protein
MDFGKADLCLAILDDMFGCALSYIFKAVANDLSRVPDFSAQDLDKLTE